MSFGSSVMCCRAVLGGWAARCLEENVGMFVYVYVIDVKLSKAATVIEDVVEKVQFLDS